MKAVRVRRGPTGRRRLASPACTHCHTRPRIPVRRSVANLSGPVERLPGRCLCAGARLAPAALYSSQAWPDLRQPATERTRPVVARAVAGVAVAEFRAVTRQGARFLLDGLLLGRRINAAGELPLVLPRDVPSLSGGKRQDRNPMPAFSVSRRSGSCTAWSRPEPASAVDRVARDRFGHSVTPQKGARILGLSRQCTTTQKYQHFAEIPRHHMRRGEKRKP